MLGLLQVMHRHKHTHTHTHTHRQTDSLDHLPNWENDVTKLTGLHVSSEGTIEDDGLGLLQVMYR